MQTKTMNQMLITSDDTSTVYATVTAEATDGVVSAVKYELKVDQSAGSIASLADAQTAMVALLDSVKAKINAL
jgi:hypothetical protein